MTNIIQYLDICADTLNRLKDQGITPNQMVIEVSEPILQQAMLVIHGQGEMVTAKYLKGPFKAEILNRGLIKLSRNGFTFHLSLKFNNFESIETRKYPLTKEDAYDGSKHDWYLLDEVGVLNPPKP